MQESAKAQFIFKSNNNPTKLQINNDKVNTKFKVFGLPKDNKRGKR